MRLPFMLVPHILAYVNPGSGLLLLQIILAGFATAAFRLATLRAKIVRFIGRVTTPGKETKNSDIRPQR